MSKAEQKVSTHFAHAFLPLAQHTHTLKTTNLLTIWRKYQSTPTTYLIPYKLTHTLVVAVRANFFLQQIVQMPKECLVSNFSRLPATLGLFLACSDDTGAGLNTRTPLEDLPNTRPTHTCADRNGTDVRIQAIFKQYVSVKLIESRNKTKKNGPDVPKANRRRHNCTPFCTTKKKSIM